jgi:hypothetical protein
MSCENGFPYRKAESFSAFAALIVKMPGSPILHEKSKDNNEHDNDYSYGAILHKTRFLYCIWQLSRDDGCKNNYSIPLKKLQMVLIGKCRAVSENVFTFLL